MSRKLVAFTLVALVSSVPVLAQTVGVVVQNPSFENGHNLADGEYISGISVATPGWVYSGSTVLAESAGVINPASDQLQPTDGNNVLWSNGGAYTQTLLDSTVMGSTYTLSVNVSSISGGTPPYADVNYSVELLLNDVAIGDAVLPALSVSAWQVATVTATINNEALANKTLKIRLGAAGPQARFDSVTLVRTVAAQGAIKFPLDKAVDDFDYDRYCPNTPPDYCNCTGSKALMEQTWLPAETLGLKGWWYDGATQQMTQYTMYGADLVSSFRTNCATNSGFRGASPPLSLRFPAQTVRLNYLDLGAMAAAIDPTKNAVNGTDENPLFVRVAFTPHSTANSQYQSSCYVQLFSGTDLAPVAYLDGEGNPQLIRICRDNTTGYTLDYPSSAIAFGFRGGQYGGMVTQEAGCTTITNESTRWYMYRHMLYDGQRWIMLKENVPYTGAPNVETSTTTIHAILRIRTTQFDLKILDQNNNLTHDVPNIPRGSSALGPFQYLAVGSSATTTTAIYVDDVAVAGDAFGTSPGGVLEYYGAVGACCKPDRTCEPMAQDLCEAIEGAQYKGPNTQCGVGVGRCCADPIVDGDHDGDVDMTDFAMFQRCITTGNPAAEIPFECLCFDTNEDGAIDTLDFANFAGTTEIPGCVSGAGVPANADCDNDF